jgi:hypothetical protein
VEATVSEMIERLAKVLAENSPGDHAGDEPRHYRDVARMAIEAMREPIEQMTDTANEADLDIYWSYRADGAPGGPDDVWRVMIDAALRD